MGSDRLAAGSYVSRLLSQCGVEYVGGWGDNTYIF